MGSSQNDVDAGKDDAGNCIGRRRFLKSIFGMGAAQEARAQVKTPPARLRSGPSCIWADLKTGQIGFPTGIDLGGGQPGSLMKLVAAAALSEENLISPNHTIECRGHIAIHKTTFHCQSAHGRVNLVDAIARSCNVFFVDASRKLRSETFLAYARKFGLDKGVAGYPSGRFPEKIEAGSYVYVLGLARDFSPNALQILRLSALLAMKGTIANLHSADQPAPDHIPFTLHLSAETWSRLEQGMQLAGRIGTAAKLDPDNVLKVAAKTGTAPVGKQFQSWVTGYFPYDAPRYAFVVYAPSGTSQDAAVPKAHQFLFASQWP